MGWSRLVVVYPYLGNAPLLLRDLSNGDLELSIKGSRAAGRGRAGRGDLLRDTLGCCEGNAQEGGTESE